MSPSSAGEQQTLENYGVLQPIACTGVSA